MVNLTDLELYSIFAEITRAFPSSPLNTNGYPYFIQPKTFAPISQPADLDSDNFAKSQSYLSKPFFFSRESANKIETFYPAIVLLQRDGVINLVDNSISTDFDLLFLDKLGSQTNSAAISGNTLANRTEEEVLQDLKLLCKQFLDEANNFIYATVEYPASVIKNIWASENYLKQQKISGDIVNYQKKESLTSYLVNRNQIPIGTMLTKESTAARTVGIALELRLKTQMCLSRPSFDYTPAKKEFNGKIC